MQKQLKKHAKKLRFAVVGGANTAFDFIILFGLVALGLDRIVANFFSTGFSMVVSFYLNRSYTFKGSSKTTKRHFAAFIAITAAGLWVIQPIIILLAELALGRWFEGAALLFIAKIIATIASLIWNYVLYSRFVFKTDA